jgi:hypothetical protein
MKLEEEDIITVKTEPLKLKIINAIVESVNGRDFEDGLNLLGIEYSHSTFGSDEV